MAEYSWLIDDIETLMTYTKDGYTKAVLNQAVKAIRKLSADVAPVRHGRYIGEYDGYADGSPVYDMWYCSECGCYFEEWDNKPTYKYCPNCGCKMDGGET